MHRDGPKQESIQHKVQKNANSSRR